MDISIYGGLGFIGSAFQKRHSVLYGMTDHIWNVPRTSRMPDPNRKSDMLYLISTTHNYNVFQDASIDVKTNLIVLTETLDNWRRHNPKGVFNLVSSWFVYGDGNRFGGYSRIPANEESPCNPKGFYSITKRTAEQLLISYADTFDLKYRILRLCNIVGKNDKGVSAQKNALQYLLHKIINSEPIDVYEKGEFYRSYMDVEDCVDAIRLVMEQGKLNSIYNIAPEFSSKFIDLVRYMCDKTNSTSQISFVDQTAFHKKVQTQSFRMDASKLYELGFKPKYDEKEIINRLI
jgi:nucleoside-diphosphate-sugar epimerase